MNNEVILDKDLFYSRAKRLRESLDSALVIMLGKRADVEEYLLNSALFNYLLGFEFSETVIVLKETPIFYTSPKKAMILEQLGTGVQIVKNNYKNDPNSITDLTNLLTEDYCVVDKKNIRGEFCNMILSSMRHKDVAFELFKIFASKEAAELQSINKAALVSSNLIKKAIDLCRDDEFSKENMEQLMNERITGVEPAFIEFPDSYVFSSTGVRFSIRYRGYSVEIGRAFLCDTQEEYAIQNYLLTFMENTLKKQKVNSGEVLSHIENFMLDKGIEKPVQLYTTGILEKELNFKENILLDMNSVYVLKIGEYFTNTFVGDRLITLRDNQEMYSTTKMKFRNKKTEIEVRSKLREHQKELLEDLNTEMVKYYTNNSEDEEEKEKDKLPVYSEDAAVPRSRRVNCDFDMQYVIIPIGSYSVPFHISNIKNVAVSANSKLRINLKESKEIKEMAVKTLFNTQLKSISITIPNADEVLAKINEMKREYAKPKIEVKKQGELKLNKSPKKFNAVLMKTDQKVANKKHVSNLELHENGFKFLDTHFLFGNIKAIFYQKGDYEKVTLIHFNLKEPILVHDKPTQNLQFHKKQGVNYHDTSRRENEHLAMLRQQEEEDELYRTNRELSAFITDIENESMFRPQLLQKGFYGVYHKESVPICVTENSLVSVNESPFLVLYMDDVEIVNFERVMYSTKTFDTVFVFKDKKKRLPKIISSIETTRLDFMKSTLDSLNKVFMETKISINWPNLIGTILKDPLNFYQNGGWADLLVEEPVEESSSSTDSDSPISSSESTQSSSGTDMSSDATSETLSTEDVDDTSSFVESDSDDYEQPKKQKRRR